MDAEKYVENRLEEEIERYERLSEKNGQMHRTLRVVEVVGAAMMPLLAGYVMVFEAAAVILGILGIVVAVAAGVLGLYQFQQKWMECREVSEGLRKEKYLYLTRSGPYREGNDEKHFRLLVQRCENLIVKEHNQWAQVEVSPPMRKAKRARRETEPSHSFAE